MSVCRVLLDPGKDCLSLGRDKEGSDREGFSEVMLGLRYLERIAVKNNG